MSSQETEIMKAAREAAILIPSLEPDGRLPAYIRKLSENGFGHIIVVDDGSSESYQSIFREVEAIDRAVVLHHDVNHGKGVALKTGYRYILENLPDVQGVITADADGQHTVPDCIRLAQRKHCTWAAAISPLKIFRPRAAAVTGSPPRYSKCCTGSICRTHRPVCVLSGRKNYPL